MWCCGKWLQLLCKGLLVRATLCMYCARHIWCSLTWLYVSIFGSCDIHLQRQTWVYIRDWPIWLFWADILAIHGPRGASRVCSAVMTGPFVPQVGYSALKPMIKYQTLSVQVSNACGLEQAVVAYISHLTLHSTITKQQCPFLRNDMTNSHFWTF